MAILSLSKKVASVDLFDTMKTGEEDAAKRNTKATGNRTAVHRYAGAAGTSASEN